MNSPNWWFPFTMLLPLRSHRKNRKAAKGSSSKDLQRALWSEALVKPRHSLFDDTKDLFAVFVSFL